MLGCPLAVVGREVACMIGRAGRRQTSGWATSMLAAAVLALATSYAGAQDMLRFLDLKSDDFTKADMTRSEI